MCGIRVVGNEMKWSSSYVPPCVWWVSADVCDSDVGGVQVGADIEARSEGEALDDPAVHPQAAQDADQVPRPTVAQEQHEDHVGNLPESPPSPHRRLGIRQWFVSVLLLIVINQSIKQNFLEWPK